MAKKNVSPSNHSSGLSVVLLGLIVLFTVIFIYRTYFSPEAMVPSGTPDITQQLASLNFGEDATNQTLSASGQRAAAITVDPSQGSGTFYVLVGAQIASGQITYSAPIVLGDRIAITSVKVEDPGQEDQGLITVEYLDRPAKAPMSAQPSKKVVAKFAFEEDGNLVRVLK